MKTHNTSTFPGFDGGRRLHRTHAWGYMSIPQHTYLMQILVWSICWFTFMSCFARAIYSLLPSTSGPMPGQLRLVQLDESSQFELWTTIHNPLEQTLQLSQLGFFLMLAILRKTSMSNFFKRNKNPPLAPPNWTGKYPACRKPLRFLHCFQFLHQRWNAHISRSSFQVFLAGYKHGNSSTKQYHPLACSRTLWLLHISCTISSFVSSHKSWEWMPCLQLILMSLSKESPSLAYRWTAVLLAMTLGAVFTWYQVSGQALDSSKW